MCGVMGHAYTPSDLGKVLIECDLGVDPLCELLPYPRGMAVVVPVFAKVLHSHVKYRSGGQNQQSKMLKFYV